jgi:hypothetical protein
MELCDEVRFLLEIYEHQLERLGKLEEGDPESWYLQLEATVETIGMLRDCDERELRLLRQEAARWLAGAYRGDTGWQDTTNLLRVLCAKKEGEGQSEISELLED